MPEDSFITFAYGSNMLTARLRARCPSVQSRGVAELPGYELRWHKRSRDGSGKCDIVKSRALGASVLGVLFQIASDDKASLDEAEGLGNGYAEIEASVVYDGAQIAVKAYKATDVDGALTPYSWYRALVIAGAKEHGLPADYIARLEAIPASDDLDRARHDRNMRLISEAHT
jgi:gamma-glutamylcyclotransferase